MSLALKLPPTLWPLAALLVVAPLDARAEDPPLPAPVHISWVRADSAASCPSGRAIEANVERRLGAARLSSAKIPPKFVEASVGREDAIWKAVIQLRDETGATVGSRTVESSATSCDSLGAAAGLAIALMLDPFLPSEAPAEPPATKPTARPVSRPVSSSPPAASAKNADAPHSLAVGVSTAAAVGVLPRLALGVELWGDAPLSQHWRVVVTGNFFPDQWTRQGAASTAFGITMGSVGSCYRVDIAPSWATSACAAVVMGALHVSVESPSPVTPGERPWWASSAGLQLNAHIGVVEMQTELSAVVHPVRHSYVVDHPASATSTSVFTESALGALASVGVGVRY